MTGISFGRNTDTLQFSNADSINYGHEKVVSVPNRPIAQTAVGIALTSQAIASCFLSGCLFIEAESSDGGYISFSDFYRTMGFIFLGAGICYSIPGISLLNIARHKWKIYNKWEMENKSVTLGLKISF